MEDGLAFDEWFSANGFSEEHRAIFAQVWNAALDNAKLEIDEGLEWTLDKLRG